jgi:mRNA interferase RelE/StbE
LPYALLTVPSVQRQLDALPARIADGLRDVLRALALDPRSRRFDLKKLVGPDDRPPLLRLRVGDYRVILQIYHDLQEIRISAIGHRSNVYRGWPGD